MRLRDNPVGVLLVELALGVHHLRLNPYPELQPPPVRLRYQVREAAGQLLRVRLPVPKPRVVAVARIFVAKPTVVQQKQLEAHLRGVVYDLHQLGFVEVEVRGLPVVEQDAALPAAVLQPVAPRPAVKAAADLPRPAAAVRVEQRGRYERFPLPQHVARRIRVDARQRPQLPERVYLKAEPEAARPRQRTPYHLPEVLLRRAVERQQEARVRELVAANAQLGVDHLYPRVQPLLAQLHLLRPRPVKLRHVVRRRAKRQVCGGEAVQRNALCLAVAHLHPLLYHVAGLVGVVAQVYLQRVVGVTERDDRLHNAVAPVLRAARRIPQLGGRVAVALHRAQGRLKGVAVAKGAVGRRPGQRRRAQLLVAPQPAAEVNLLQLLLARNPKGEARALRAHDDKLLRGENAAGQKGGRKRNSGGKQRKQRLAARRHNF